jgi:FlaA1/EpsC-like NDP-sugar epimerase
VGKLIPDIRTFTFDYGSPFIGDFLRTNAYDFVFNFAAVKHVRSEKDPFSAVHLIQNNILKMGDFCEQIKAHIPRRFFTISTDKAANPTSLMGASKRFMEHMLFSLPHTLHVTSTRFANVAFSAGSLLEGWGNRIAKCQPLPVPTKTRRYFISHEEAAQICLLSALLIPSHHLTVPAFPQEKAFLLEDIAAQFVLKNGYTPVWFEDESEAIASCEGLMKENKWPVLKTALDTAGEKDCEEFVGSGENAIALEGLVGLRGIDQRDCVFPEAAFTQFTKLLQGPQVPKLDALVSCLRSAVPTYTPTLSEKSLDGRL